MFVEFEYFNGRIAIWANKVAAIVETPKGAEIYVDGSDDPFAVPEPYDEVKKKLSDQSQSMPGFVLPKDDYK